MAHISNFSERTRSRLTNLAQFAIRTTTRMGAGLYERETMLPRLTPLGLGTLSQQEPARSRGVVLLLAKALRAERALGRAGHWTYDLNRHIGLMQAYKAECEALRQRRKRPL